jgi:hypothetical protein
VRATVWILIGPEVNEELRWTTGSGPQSLSTQRRAIRRDIVREIDIVPGGR